MSRTASATQGDRPSARAWSVLVLLTFLNVLNFVDRQLIASLAPMLITDLNLSRAQIGLLAGFAFVVFYTVVGMFLGPVADRLSRPRLVAGGLALWSVMTAVSGSARTFLHLAVPRMLVGVGEATLTPSALSMLADVFPATRLGLATGIYYAGIPLGTALSLLLAAWLAPQFGWRACFYVLGLIGLPLAAVLLFLPDPRASRAASRDQGTHQASGATSAGLGDSARTLWRTLTAVPSYWLSLLGGSLLAYGSAAALLVITWLVQERQFPFARAAFVAGVIAVTSGFAGNLLGGWFSDACQRRFRAGRLWSLVIITAFCTPFAVALYLLPPSSAMFYVCWFVASAATTAYFGPLFAIVQEVSPVRIRATAVACALLALNLLGVGPGPWVTGLIGDRASLTLGLLVSLAVAATSIVPFAVAARHYERDVVRARQL